MYIEIYIGVYNIIINSIFYLMNVNKKILHDCCGLKEIICTDEMAEIVLKNNKELENLIKIQIELKEFRDKN